VCERERESVCVCCIVTVQSTGEQGSTYRKNVAGEDWIWIDLNTMQTDLKEVGVMKKWDVCGGCSYILFFCSED
jgi:hypothetical protein